MKVRPVFDGLDGYDEDVRAWSKFNDHDFGNITLNIFVTGDGTFIGHEVGDEEAPLFHPITGEKLEYVDSKDFDGTPISIDD